MKKKKWLLSRRALENLLVVLAGVAFYLLLSNLKVVGAQVARLSKILSPFITGFALAYLLNLPMNFFEKKVYRRLRRRRALSILTVYLLALALLGVLLGMVLPQLVQSIVALAGNVPTYLQNLNSLLDFGVKTFHLNEGLVDQLGVTYEDIVRRVTGLAAQMAPQLLNFSVALGNGVVTGLTALISSLYMLFGKDKLIFQLKKVAFALMPTARARRVLGVFSHANEIFASFINGKILDSAIIGVLCFVCMSLFHMPLALLVSVVVGVTNVIPFFGPFIGAIPSAMILLIVDPWSAFWFLILIVALQQFDGNILGPMILQNSTGLSAIWVMVAIIVGGGLFGFAGMLLGVPTFAVLYSLSSDLIAACLKTRGIDAAGNPLPGGDGQDAEAKGGTGC